MQEMPRPNVYPILEKTLRIFFFKDLRFLIHLTTKSSALKPFPPSRSFIQAKLKYLLLTIIYLSPFANNSFFSQYHFESLNQCFQVVRNNLPYKPKRPFHKQLLHFPSFTKIMGSHVNLTISEK